MPKSKILFTRQNSWNLKSTCEINVATIVDQYIKNNQRTTLKDMLETKR